MTIHDEAAAQTANSAGYRQVQAGRLRLALLAQKKLEEMLDGTIRPSGPLVRACTAALQGLCGDPNDMIKALAPETTAERRKRHIEAALWSLQIEHHKQYRMPLPPDQQLIDDAVTNNMEREDASRAAIEYDKQTR